ncbi:copper resistance CopC/CopD family protein [Kribbella alba]
MRRLLIMLGLAIAYAFATAGPSAAHTGLLTSEPAAGSVVTSAPHQVVLTFREAVTVVPGSVRVYDDRMRRVDIDGIAGTTTQQVVRAVLPGRLGQGTYSVAWRVVSADGHPAAGNFRFSIGAPSSVVGTIPSGDDSGDAGVLLGLLRGLGYLGLAAGPGVLMVVLALWPAGRQEARPRRMIWSGLALLAVSSLGAIAVASVWTSGNSLGDTWHGSSHDAASGLSDFAYAARFYSLLALGVVIGVSAVLERPLRLLTGIASLALLCTWPLAGHAVTGRQVPLAVAADLLHLTAMTLWLGGLALVAVSLARPALVLELAAVLPRFSRLAFSCVVVLVITGTYQAWRELGSVSALTSTPLGRLLLVKVSFVAVLVAFGALARRWVQRHLIPTVLQVQVVAAGPVSAPVGDTVMGEMVVRQVLPDRKQIRALRQGLVAELCIGVVVLGVTAALVATSTAV